MSKPNQSNQGKTSRLMYIENKDGEIDGYQARIGWVNFSKSGLSIYYRGRRFSRLKGGHFIANYCCEETGHKYWISGVKKYGSNTHYEPVKVHIDNDAKDEYESIKSIHSKP